MHSERLKKVLDFIEINQTVTLSDEILAEYQDLAVDELNNIEIKKALENNRIKLKQKVKNELSRNGTTQSLMELNRIIDNESNSKKVSDFIDNIAKEWKSNGN